MTQVCASKQKHVLLLEDERWRCVKTVTETHELLPLSGMPGADFLNLFVFLTCPVLKCFLNVEGKITVCCMIVFK